MRSVSLTRLAEALGINSVPIVGVFFGDWSTATTLVVYWSETLLAALFTAVRTAAHRKLTRKKGHYRDQWEKSPRARAHPARPSQRFRTFLSGFLTGSLILIFGLGLFLALLLATVLEGSFDIAAVEGGVFWMAVAQGVALAWDLHGIRARPFAWVRNAAADVMGRVVLIHFGLLGGMFVLSWLGGQVAAFFGTFVAMKLAADLIALWAHRRADPTPPRKPAAWAAGFWRISIPTATLRPIGGTIWLVIGRSRRKMNRCTKAPPQRAVTAHNFAFRNRLIRKAMPA